MADGDQVPLGVAPDGTVVFATLDSGGSTISKVNPAQPSAVTVLVDHPQDAPEGALSRDGRYLAYQAGTGSGWQIRILDLTTGRHTTIAAGWSPAWSPDGTALMFQQGDGGVFVVPFSPAAGVAGTSVPVMPAGLTGDCCDLAVDHRVLALLPAATSAEFATVVINWPAAVARRRD